MKVWCCSWALDPILKRQCSEGFYAALLLSTLIGWQNFDHPIRMLKNKHSIILRWNFPIWSNPDLDSVFIEDSWSRGCGVQIPPTDELDEHFSLFIFCTYLSNQQKIVEGSLSQSIPLAGGLWLSVYLEIDKIWPLVYAIVQIFIWMSKYWIKNLDILLLLKLASPIVIIK